MKRRNYKKNKKKNSINNDAVEINKICTAEEVEAISKIEKYESENKNNYANFHNDNDNVSTKNNKNIQNTKSKDNEYEDDEYIKEEEDEEEDDDNEDDLKNDNNICYDEASLKHYLNNKKYSKNLLSIFESDDSVNSKKSLENFKIEEKKEIKESSSFDLFKNVEPANIISPRLNQLSIYSDNKITVPISEYLKYRLVFILEKSTTRNETYSIRLGCQRIKEPGVYSSKIINYKRGILSEPLSEIEKILSDMIAENNITNIDSILKKILVNKKNNFYYNEVVNKDLYIPVKSYKIKSISLNFGLFQLNRFYHEDKTSFYLKMVSVTINDKYTLEIDKNFKDYKSFDLYFFTNYIKTKSKCYLFYFFDNYYASKIINFFINKSLSEQEYHDLKILINEYNKTNSEITIIVPDIPSKGLVKYVVPETIIELENNESSIAINFIFSYEGMEISYSNKNEKSNNLSKIENNCVLVYERDYKYEENVIEYLLSNEEYKIHRDYSWNTYTIEDMNLKEFMIKYANKLIEEKINLRIAGFKKNIKRTKGRLTFNVSSGIDWFDIDVNYQDEDGNTYKILLDKLLMNNGIISIGENYVILAPEDIPKLKKYFENGMNQHGQFSISKLQFKFIEELYNEMDERNEELEKINQLYQKLKNFKNIEKRKIPKNLKTKLRDYQKHGYYWLNFLYEYKVNGCLADDMGLGKTIQTLSLLLHLKEVKNLKLNLLVVPVSTLPNWESEIKKFAPNLTFCVHAGQTRVNDIEYLSKFDIIIVSYHTLRNDIEIFSQIQFDYIILDESQNIKNVSSLIFKAVKTLKSERRLTLTGTPIENNTLELWSQMNFLNPGLLGSLSSFKSNYTRPIEQDNNESKAEELRKIIFPFMLRRKKEDVLKDLPDLSEIYLYSEMLPKQKELYNELKLYYQAKIKDILVNDKHKQNSIIILTALLKLRQISLFPQLVDKTYFRKGSGKYEQLKEHLTEILSENHKILIFSQFVEVLKIILNNFVKKNKINYSYIDGSYSANDRKKEINKFQNDDKTNLFLLSLKTGGVGINLTAADYVIIFDPWWNPAVEDQAVSRAHRIGQKNKVIAYKMITKDSIEEKILQLQMKKKKLVKNIVTTDAGFFKNLQKEDIKNLFS